MNSNNYSHSHRVE